MRIILIFVIVFVFYKLQAMIYIKRCFDNVDAELRFNHSGIFQGEKTELIETFSNRKLMPLWWVGVKFLISRHINFEEEINENEGNDNYRKDIFFLMPYEKVTKRFTITGVKRGYYKIEELELNSGDLFGNYKAIRKYPASEKIYVYPKLIDSEIIDIEFLQMNGEVLTKRHLLEDPFQLRGIREYYPYDSIKMVNWNATARSGELKVNQYDYTASQQIKLFLNVERFNAWDPEKIVEECISLAASISTRYLAMGVKVEIICNGCDITTRDRVIVSPGAGLGHNVEIFESLAKIDISKITEPIAEIFELETSKLRKDVIYILISHYYDENLINQVKLAKSRGLGVKWILPKLEKSEINFELDKDLILWEVKDI